MSIKTILEDYKPLNDHTQEDGDLMVHLKDIIYNKLKDTERNIIILYAELKSQREVAKHLCVSAATANIKINQIRDKIKQYLNNGTYNF